MKRGIVLLFTVLLAAYAQAGISIGSLTLEKSVKPGDVCEGAITLTNDGSTLQDVEVYQTDYRFYSDGTNRFDDPGSQPRSNAGWIVFSPRNLQVPPHGSAQVSYRIVVPGDSMLAGTFWSMIMVEEVPPPSDTTIYLARNQTSVRQVMRYGVQCVTHVGDSGERKVKFTGTRLVMGNSQTPQLEVDVENTGERWVVPTAWVELYDSTGHSVGRIDGEKKRIFPGSSVRFHLPVGSVPPGKYKALVVLDNGDQNVFGAKYDLEF